MKAFKFIPIFTLLFFLTTFIGFYCFTKSYYVVTFKSYQELDFINFDGVLLEKNKNKGSSFINLNKLIQNRLEELAFLNNDSLKCKENQNIYRSILRKFAAKTTTNTLRRIYEVEIMEYIYSSKNIKRLHSTFHNQDRINELKDLFWNCFEEDLQLNDH